MSFAISATHKGHILKCHALCGQGVGRFGVEFGSTCISYIRWPRREIPPENGAEEAGDVTKKLLSYSVMASTRSGCERVGNWNVANTGGLVGICCLHKLTGYEHWHHQRIPWINGIGDPNELARSSDRKFAWNVLHGATFILVQASSRRTLVCHDYSVTL